MPLEDNSIDICIMSLALWGSNCEEYIQEALRVLDENGILKYFKKDFWKEFIDKPANTNIEFIVEEDEDDAV